MDYNGGMQNWHPISTLQYDGPYPQEELQHARSLLITCLRYPRTELLKFVMPKIGISSNYGPGQHPPPLPPPQGYIRDEPVLNRVTPEYEDSPSNPQKPLLSSPNQAPMRPFLETPSKVPLLTSPNHAPQRPLLEIPRQRHPRPMLSSPILQRPLLSTPIHQRPLLPSPVHQRPFLANPRPAHPNSLSGAPRFRHPGNYGDVHYEAQDSYSPTDSYDPAYDNVEEHHNYELSQESFEPEPYDIPENDELSPKDEDESQQSDSNMPVFFSNINKPSRRPKVRNFPLLRTPEMPQPVSRDHKQLKRKLDNEKIQSYHTKPNISENSHHRTEEQNVEASSKTLDLGSNVNFDQIRAIVNNVNASTSLGQGLNYKTSSDNYGVKNQLTSLSYEERNKIPCLDDSQSDSEKVEDIPLLGPLLGHRQEEEKFFSSDHAKTGELEGIRNFKVWSSDDPHGMKLTSVQKIFKCDSCCFASKSIPAIKHHLETVCHYSASSYVALVESDCIQLISVHNMLEVVYEAAMFKSQVIVCPECKDFYQDVFMCGLHYKREHGSVNGQYTVCPVEGETEYESDKCSDCQMLFPNAETLKAHWKQNPLHDPTQKVKSRNSVTLFFCQYKKCRQVFYNNFHGALSHSKIHLLRQSKKASSSIYKKDLTEPESSKFVGRTIYIPKSNSHELPMFDSVEGNAFWKELRVRQRMQAFYSGYHRSAKQKKNTNRMHCKILRQHLGCEQEDSPESEEDEEEKVIEQPAMTGWSY